MAVGEHDPTTSDCRRTPPSSRPNGPAADRGPWRCSRSSRDRRPMVSPSPVPRRWPGGRIGVDV